MAMPRQSSRNCLTDMRRTQLERQNRSCQAKTRCICQDYRKFGLHHAESCPEGETRHRYSIHAPRNCVCVAGAQDFPDLRQEARHRAHRSRVAYQERCIHARRLSVAAPPVLQCASVAYPGFQAVDLTQNHKWPSVARWPPICHSRRRPPSPERRRRTYAVPPAAQHRQAYPEKFSSQDAPYLVD